MSWIQELIRTYDDFQDEAGMANETDNTLLEPVGHMIAAAHIEMCIKKRSSGDTVLVTARALEKPNGKKEDGQEAENEMLTLIPCTPQSASRTAGLAPHPLEDKLEYIARDYGEYGDGKKGKNFEAYEMYIEQLKDWVESPEGQEIPELQTIYEYLRDHDVIAELAKERVLVIQDGKIADKWDGAAEDKPPIFNSGTAPDKSLVRFTVIDEWGRQTFPWKEKKVQDAFISYYLRKIREGKEEGVEKGICFASGQEDMMAPSHGKYIRNRGDGAKIISGQERSDNLKYSGRFTDAKEATGLSYENSQKAMNALRWLIARQGINYYGKVFLMWGREESKKVSPRAKLGAAVNGGRWIVEEDFYREPTTKKEIAREYNRILFGTAEPLEKDLFEKMNVMILDAATPGRLSILFYDQFYVNDYLERLVLWHSRSNWILYMYRNDEGKLVSAEGIYPFRNIIKMAYGENANDKIKRNAMERIFMSIINGQKVPRDIVQALVRKTLTKAALACGSTADSEGMNFKTWLELLDVSCSMVKNYLSDQEGKGYEVSLDTTCRNRSYLFGRLLAIADNTERTAMDYSQERLTNAMQYMNAFSQRPSTTWALIYRKLQPYMGRLKNNYTCVQKDIDEIIDLFEMEDFASNVPLEPVFLMGFSHQRRAIENKKEENKNKKEKGEE